MSAEHAFVRGDPSILPVGAMFRSALDKHDRDLEDRVRPLLHGPDRAKAIEAFVNQLLTWDLRLAPKAPTFPAARWLSTALILGEVAKRGLVAASYRGFLPPSALLALVAGVFAARVLRLHSPQRAPPLLAALVFLRCAGLGVLFVPTTAVASYFVLAKPAPPRPDHLQDSLQTPR